MRNACAIVLAGGSGTRMGGGRNKILLPLGGVPAIARTLQAFQAADLPVVLVARENDMPALRALLTEYALPVLAIVPGGDTRQASVRCGLNALPPDTRLVLVHDGARALVSPGLIERVLACAEARGSGVAALPVTDTVKRADSDARVLDTLPRNGLYAMQTPQGFMAKDLLLAHERAEQDGFIGTDDAALLEHIGLPVVLCEGERNNIKLTTPADIALAEALLHKGGARAMRIGHGMDTHRLVEGRSLVLCGVTVPYARGLLGHSDADVAVHALMDAMLGALALGDIGMLFPDTDERYRGASSIALLREVASRVADAGYCVGNADITIVAQAPKLRPYIDRMRAALAAALQTDPNQISVKATTTEGLGFEGEGLGISAHAVCTLLP